MDEIESILTSTKKALGIAKDYTVFDPDLIMHINSVFAVLNQLGVGPEEPFVIEDDTAKWDEFITQTNTENVKSYMFLKVKTIFDPPSTATMHEAYEKMTSEMEWRMTVAADPIEEIQNE